MGMYERYAEHTLKTNGKTKVEQINDVFYSHTPNLGHPFLIEKKLYDIDLPSSKMRALDFIENYDDPDIKRRLEASIKLGLYNKHAMFKKDRCEEKKAICIHFPAGWENAPNTSANTNRSAVNYYVHRDGTILELGEPELWDHHSSCGSRNKNIIAIEIVNVGPLKREGNCLFFEGSNYCDIDNSLEGHGKAYIDLENNPYDPKGIYPEGSYRGYRYYAAWTTDQMRSLKKLLKALCAAYDIPYKFLPPEYRFKYFPSLGYVTPTAPEMQKYCYQDSIITYADGFKWLEERGIGIISHVNTALVSRTEEEKKIGSNAASTSISKWDIGPAFDWNYLENTLQTAYPYQSPASALKEPNPLHWFDNPELRRQGGYFPIGANGAAHAGMHLFAPSPNSQAVSAMADGSVVAFRFYSAEQRRGQEENRPEELRNLANPTHSGFVLLKHDFSLTGREEDDVKSFYSLYMDLQPPSEGTTVPWVERLRELAKGCSLSLEYDNLGLPVAKGTSGAHERPPMNVLANLDFAGSVPVHKSNEHGVISFSEPWLTVGGKETIGYTSSLGGEDNYCHWEVFATEKDVITGLANLLGDQNDGGDFSFEELGEAEDGIFSADELNSLLDPEENRFERPFLNLGPLQFKENGRDITLKDHLKSRFSEKNPMTYNLTLKMDESPSYRLKDDLEFQFQTYDGDGRVLLTETKTTAELNGGTQIEVSSQTEVLRLFPPADRGFSNTLTYHPGPSYPLFEEAARHGGLLRNSLLSMPSPWSESSLEKLIDALKSLIYISPAYAFAAADLAVINLFTEEQEEAVFESVFGRGALIDPSQPIHAVHPALFLWLLRLNGESLTNRCDSMIDCENPLKQYGFSMGESGDAPKLGDKVKLLVLAEHNRPGIPKEGEESGIELLDVGANRQVAVTLDSHGMFTGEMNIDHWGTYGNSDLTPIPGLRSAFTVPAPTWSDAEITDDHRLRIEGISDAPNPAPFICQMKIHFGIPPLAFVELTHYLLIGASLLPPMNTMECGIEPSNPESFTDILVRAIESVHGKSLYPEGAVWSDYLKIKPRLYNGGISFLMTSDGKPIEPDLFQRGYYLSEEDMGDAPDEYVEGNPLDRGSLTLPPVPIEQAGTVTEGVNFRQKENGRENLSGRGNLSKNDRVTLFLNPLTGERIAKRWTYDNNRGPLNFYLVRSPSGELGWAYCPYIN